MTVGYACRDTGRAMMVGYASHRRSGSLRLRCAADTSPESDGEKAKWLSDDTRHMLAELTPTPDQVTVVVNTVQMNLVEQMEPADLEGTSISEPTNYNAYREMTVPGGPGWVEEHVKRLTAKGIQSAFQFGNINSFESFERMVRRGAYMGPL